MPQNKRYIYVNAFVGEPKVTDFVMVTEDVPPLQNGEILCEAMYLSVDSYVRTLSHQLVEGQTMAGTQVAKVVESRHHKYPVGAMLLLDCGWTLYSVCAPDITPAPMLLTDLNHFPASLALGVLGAPGNVAYHGLLEVCRPELGEVVAVSGAAGAVGSVVAQIAKIKGCKVVGIAESEEQAAWLRDELGLDASICHIGSDLTTTLRKAVPEGIDCYFDNVGGEVSTTVMSQMNHYGRVACCGAIAVYNTTNNGLTKVTPVQPNIIARELRLEGLSEQRWASRRDESFKILTKWLVEGKVRYRETVTEGFEKLPAAMINMLRGEGVGKAIVRG